MQIAYADDLRAYGAAVSLTVYPDAYHGFDRPTFPHSVPRATSERNCHGRYDLDTRTFAMFRDGRTLSGADADAEARQCLSLGATLGGDPVGRENAPADVATFLKSAFGREH
jgi:dienelactone hydrolase